MNIFNTNKYGWGRFQLLGNWILLVILISGTLLLSACGFDYYGCHNASGTSDSCSFNSPYQPVYMSYEELRSSIELLPDQTPSNFGKIYIYQHYLLINSFNEGIFIYDNSDVENPAYLTFLRIPGNLDIEIRDGYLYADSYIDLVAINIRSPQDIVVSARIEEHFPYDAHQNVPDFVYFDNIDRRKGVVIGYKEE